ncbi:hypothetical protein [Photobacterium carnosum]|uniref:hypothetical protein n=1 Tax=Photobacterium carnosum TaxID=2023717 RepID=UPI001E6501E3|nr:hypothetical protein [Photobacterium carnosum]MCD9527933.1 hypothetical protein [Photobacterium carnosum]
MTPPLCEPYISMNKPFESIRKLALSKLDQFKTYLLIALYLSLIFPFMALGYLMGRTTPESSKWLLDLSSLLGSIGSLLGGLATVFAAWVAFGAYGTWKKQITHLEIVKYENEKLKELQLFHEKTCNWIRFDACSLKTAHSIHKGEIDNLDENDLNFESNKKDSYLKLKDSLREIRLSFKSAGLSTGELHDILKPLLNNIKHGEMIDAVIYRYIECFKGYYESVYRLMIVERYINKTEMDYFYEGSDNIDYLGCLSCDSDLYKRLNKSYDEINTYYNKKFYGE